MILALILAALQSESIDALIDRLGSDDIDVREEASARLKKIGEAAGPALFNALNSSDAELVARASGLLQALARSRRTTRIWSLENSDPDQVIGFLRQLPLFGPPPEITADARTRSVIVRATTADLEILGQLISEIDQQRMVRVHAFRCGGDAASLALTLQQLLKSVAR